MSHDIRDIFRTFRAGRSYHAPLIEKVGWNEAWAAVERANNFTRPGAIATRDVHIGDTTTAIACIELCETRSRPPIDWQYRCYRENILRAG